MSREGDYDGAHWHSQSALPDPRRRRVAVGGYLECVGERPYPSSVILSGKERVFNWC